MYILRIYVFIFLFLVVLAFPFIKIEPEKQFHDKRNSLIVACNTTSNNKRAFLLYTFDGNNFTIPRIGNNDSYVYNGNLTVTDPKQFRVNVMCLEEVSFELMGAKIYLFGYPPKVVLTGDSTPKLTCQDYNLRRVLCCMSPSENEIARLTGLVEEQNGHLKIELINTQSEEVEPKFNNSCFNVSQAVFTHSLSFTLLISNDLGRQQYNFSYNRYDILKPETPKLFLSEFNKDLHLKIEMVDDGEFMINITCFSNSPKIITKPHIETVTRRVTIIIFNGWLPYSVVSCQIQSIIKFGPTPMGNYSELSISRYRMLEAEPNIGPITSPALMKYESSDDGLLRNIVLYFLDLRLIDQNGIIIKYMWNCENCFHLNGLQINGNEIIDKNFRSIKISKAEINTSISITACTAVGCSKIWSKVHLIKLFDPEIKERIYLIHNNNDNNNNNWYLLWYLNNQSFEETSPNFGIPNRRETQPSVLLCYTERNETMNPENKCSSTELIPLNQLNGKQYLSVNNRIPVQFAFIQSFNNSHFSKLSWFTCLYEKSRDSEAALTVVKYDEYVSHEINCSFSKCKVYLKIKIPACFKLNTVIFEGIKIEYQKNTGNKNISQYFNDRNEMMMLISDLNSDQYYYMKIIVITANNDILWGTYKLYTGWYAVYKVLLIIIAIIVVISIFVIGIRKCYKRQANDMFKKNFMCTSQRTMKNSSIKPLTLNNAADTSRFSQNDSNFPSSAFNSSYLVNQQYTDLTTIDSTPDTSDSHYSSANTSEDTNECHENSGNSYITRPEQIKMPASNLSFCNIPNYEKELYMTLVEVDDKKKNETMMNEWSPPISV